MEEEIDVTNETAINVSKVNKHYGKLHALQDLDMSVSRGRIYGLLGPSGCGKTTLLRCIIGRLNIDSGSIYTLGNRPGTLGHGVPGKKVGYMPQELALYREFSVRETLYYFGRLHRMGRQQIKKRITFLLDFLHLPEETRIIKNLSGGQQRRTSFAIALLQEPELLILDEPTVGVDPLLRERIWQHLVHISVNYQTTIIITTHYVEEARQAHMVGLMRNGRLLAESPPNVLMQKYEKQSLEAVFLKLCEEDQIGDIEQNDIRSVSTEAADVEQKSNPRYETMNDLEPLIKDDRNSFPSGPSGCAKLKYWMPSFWNIIALIIKNLTVLRRNIGALLFEFALPAFQVTLFCLCIGRTPFDLPMAVVNFETDGYCPSPPNHIANVSCYFLSFIDNGTIIQNNFESRLEDALESVKSGNNWGVIEIPANFTQHLFKRFVNNGTLTNATLEGSTVKMHMDMTNQQIALTIETTVLDAMEKFLSAEVTAAGKDSRSLQVPIQYEDPIYGEQDVSFTNFMAPGIIISITFFMATGLTALSFVLERKQGLMDRSFTAGVTTTEVMVGHICTQFLVMCVQVSIMLAVVLGGFHVIYKGPLVLVIILTLMQGLVGMALGLLISTVCEEETAAIQAALGSVYPNLLISGIIWPLQAMPQWLRYISSVLPMTYAAEAMRCILARGWSITDMPVWRGILVSLAWGWGLMAISAIVLKFRKL